MYVLCHSGGFPFFHLHSECVTKVTQKVIDVVGSLFNGYSVSVMCLYWRKEDFTGETFDFELSCFDPDWVQ